MSDSMTISFYGAEAARVLQLAQIVTDSETKLRLLEIAELFEKLALSAEEQAQRLLLGGAEAFRTGGAESPPAVGNSPGTSEAMTIRDDRS